jgi:hypothetical protein
VGKDGPKILISQVLGALTIMSNGWYANKRKIIQLPAEDSLEDLQLAVIISFQ